MSEPTPPSPEQQAPKAARHRERAPKSADAKMRGLAARKMARQIEQLKATKDARKMEDAAVMLAKLNGEEPPAKSEAPAEAPPAKSQEARSALSAVPATADASKPGWPSEAALADAAPTVRQLVDVVAVMLAGTRFDILTPFKVVVGERVVECTKAAVLAEKLTPLAAKYGAAVQQTPEILAAVGLLTVFGQPLMELALERVAAGRVQAGALAGAS